MNSEQIHGHEVMRMMLERPGGWTRESLREAIVGRFGEAALFFTCSEEGMTADELITFLEARGKFHDSDSGFQTSPERICGHEPNP